MTVKTRADRVNILLVDDQPAKLLTYETILEELGENLIAVGSANEALECLLRDEIAVVLVDVCMPEFDGYELAAMIRQHPRCQQTSIIFVSAVLMTDLDRLRGYECGAVDYVPVPVVPDILRAKVAVFAELYRKERALARLNAELEQRVSTRTAELEATAAALKVADRRKDEFLAMLAHELRNPLAPIRTAVQLLRLDTLGASDTARARDIIERQVEHLVRLIDDLLDVSRITCGMITLHRAPVAVAAIVARAVETARPALDARGHELVIDVAASEPVCVDGDETRLVQVVGNILHNAAKFTDPGGRVVLRVSREGELAVISVKDTGIGIQKDSLPRVFDLFARFHTHSAPGQNGLGIGLSLVKRLVAMHGGSVTAHSDGPGLGTEFIVRLALLHPASSRGTDELSNTGVVVPIEPRRILMADDNFDAVEALSTLLTMRGHDIRVAHDGMEALAVGETFRPDVVLLDLGMAKMDGYETAREIRNREWGGRAVIVALTGWGQEDDRLRTAAAGFDAHLVKPVTDTDVFRTLAAVTRAITKTPG